jgi:hypothetical protein
MITTGLWLLVAQGVLGAFDTLYYHEYRAHLPAGGAQSRPELVLHAARDFVYALLFATLATWQWGGWLAPVLLVLITAEIGITLTDFAIEDRVRVPLGGVFVGERATHTLMALVYGAALGHLVPVFLADRLAPTGFGPRQLPSTLVLVLRLLAVGVFVSGVRDALAAARGPRGGWPWPPWR